MDNKELVLSALKAAENSYAPYSQFNVGAALLTKSGKVYLGCNVENAAYGSTICAERTELVKAVSEGHRDDLERIAIVGNSADYCWPCGPCRQMLYEFNPDMTVLVARSDGAFVSLPLHELLPYVFGPGHLTKI